jgi:hypothetical protein
MRFDSYGILVREKPREPGHEIANLGDGCADTCRAYILEVNHKGLHPVMRFTDEWQGFLRHPELKGIKDWDKKSFTNDQLVPLIMAQYLQHPAWVRSDLFVSCGFIRGTWKLAQPMVYALLYKQWWLVDRLNRLQGWFLTLPFRWSDRAQDVGFESIKGQVQDYPTMICTTVFLNKIGYKAVLPRPQDECLAAILKYRHDPADFEPNAEWEIDLYKKALGVNV